MLMSDKQNLGGVVELLNRRVVVCFTVFSHLGGHRSATRSRCFRRTRTRLRVEMSDWWASLNKRRGL
jgi:hypothetical protein